MAETQGAMRRSGPAALPGSVTEICPGRIYAVGGSIPADRPLSWFPVGISGWLPVQAYVLKDHDHFLLLDTGLTVHKEGIRQGIEALIQGCSRRNLVVSRREPDNIINLPWIVRDFGMLAVYAGGDLNPLEFFETVDEANAYHQIKATTGAEAVFIRAGSRFEVGALSIEVLPTTLKVLSTHWLYEDKTRTLFTSDTWAFLTDKQPNGSFVITPSPEDISAQRIVNYMLAKFDWLCGIDTTPIIASLADVTTDRRIDRVCPSSGGVIEGHEAVAMLIEQTVLALRMLDDMPRSSVMGGFSFPRV